MPYGIMDKATADILRENGIDPEAILAPENATAAWDIAIVFDGALDESFLIGENEDYRQVADVIAERLRADFPDNTVEVWANRVFIAEDFIESTGYTEDNYEA